MSLTFRPFVSRFKKQISAASQQLLVGITICKHNWSVCFAQAFGFFPGIRVCLNGIPSMRDAHLPVSYTHLDVYKRQGHYMPFEIVTIPELRATASLSEAQQKEKEGGLILQKVQPHIISGA